jgi:hypothetical protein
MPTAGAADDRFGDPWARRAKARSETLPYPDLPGVTENPSGKAYLEAGFLRAADNPNNVAANSRLGKYKM